MQKYHLTIKLYRFFANYRFSFDKNIIREAYGSTIGIWQEEFTGIGIGWSGVLDVWIGDLQRTCDIANT